MPKIRIEMEARESGLNPELAFKTLENLRAVWLMRHKDFSATKLTLGTAYSALGPEIIATLSREEEE